MKAVTINVVGTAFTVLPVGQRRSMRAAPLSLHQLQCDRVTHLRLHLPQHPYTATQTPPCTLQPKHLSMLPYCNPNTTINAPILQHKHHPVHCNTNTTPSMLPNYNKNTTLSMVPYYNKNTTLSAVPHYNKNTTLSMVPVSYTHLTLPTNHRV